MRFRENNNGGILCEFDLDERGLVYNALDFFMKNCKGEELDYLAEITDKAESILKVLDSPEIYKVGV